LFPAVKKYTIYISARPTVSMLTPVYKELNISFTKAVKNKAGVYSNIYDLLIKDLLHLNPDFVHKEAVSGKNDINYRGK
jgi:hypothetical protein